MAVGPILAVRPICDLIMNISERCLLTLVTTTLALGCGVSGPELGTVTGTVSVDNKPAANVVVSFRHENGGRNSSATTDSEGTYTLQYSSSRLGALIGKHTVSVRPSEPSVDIEGNQPTGEVLIDTAVPEAYLQQKKTVEVKSGANTINLAWP